MPVLFFRKRMTSMASFGVTNASLVDPAVAQVYVPKPKPEEPDEPDSSEEPGDTSHHPEKWCRCCSSGSG